MQRLSEAQVATQRPNQCGGRWGQGDSKEKFNQVGVGAKEYCAIRPGSTGSVLGRTLKQVREFGLILQAWQEMLKRPEHSEGRDFKS